MANFIPSIGVKGLYHLLSPFDTALLPNVPYECTAIRSMSELVASGIDPQATYYTPAGLTTAIYLSDTAAQVRIITLQSDSGIPVYVPSTYLNTFPDIGGVPYTTLVLAINIGAIPDYLNLAYLKSKIAATVLENLGIVSEVKTVVVSQPTILSQATHATVEAAREAIVGVVSTDYARYLAAAAQRDSALKKIVELETYVFGLHASSAT